MATNRRHPALNTISVVDKFRVKAYSLGHDLHFVFQAHSDLGPNRPAEFNCHIYDSASLNHCGYIETSTVATDSPGMFPRSSATGKTLDELVINLDWAHMPSELALLRMHLATRVCTDNGALIGDLVLRRMSDQEAQGVSERRALRVAESVEKETERLTRASAALIEEAAQLATHAARYGVRRAVQPDFLKIGT